MDHEPSLDDTQPRPAVELEDTKPQPAVNPPPEPAATGATGYDEEPVYRGPGCLMWSCVSLIGMGFAVVIVILAAFAGWTSGQREASVIATATQNASIMRQLNLIPGDLAQGNLQLANSRLQFLATHAPGAAGVPELAETATAAYLQSLPTETPTPAPTNEPTEEPGDNDDLLLTPSDDESGFDLAALLAEARQDVEAGHFAEAYELLDVIAAVDENFEAQTVRQLTARALNGQARALFNANRPAEAIVWASIAEDMQVLEGDLSFELFAAMRYLDATAAIGLSYPRAIAALQDIVNLGPGRYYETARTQLVQQYTAYADAYVAEGNHCAAVPQYQNALRISNNPSISAKLENAEQICAQGTPIPADGLTPGAPGQQTTPSSGVAPIG